MMSECEYQAMMFARKIFFSLELVQTQRTLIAGLFSIFYENFTGMQVKMSVMIFNKLTIS